MLVFWPIQPDVANKSVKVYKKVCIFSKTQFDFWGGILQQKKQLCYFVNLLILNKSLPAAISSNDFKLCNFKRCFSVWFLWSCLCHLWYTQLRYSKLCLAYVTYVVLVFSSRIERWKTFLRLYHCLIDKLSLCNSFFYSITYTRAVTFHASRFRLGRHS